MPIGEQNAYCRATVDNQSSRQANGIGNKDNFLLVLVVVAVLSNPFLLTRSGGREQQDAERVSGLTEVRIFVVFGWFLYVAGMRVTARPKDVFLLCFLTLSFFSGMARRWSDPEDRWRAAARATTFRVVFVVVVDFLIGLTGRLPRRRCSTAKGSHSLHNRQAVVARRPKPITKHQRRTR